MTTSATGRAVTRRKKEPAALTARHRELIDAAAAAFHEKGYHGSSIQQIADRMGILKGSIYYYVASKEDLLDAVITEIHESALDAVADIDAFSPDPLERIVEFVRRHIRHSVDHMTSATVFYRDFTSLSRDRRVQIRSDRNAYAERLSELIREAQASGQARADLDVELATLAILGMANWVYQWYREGISPDSESIGERFGAYALDIIVGRP